MKRHCQAKFFPISVFNVISKEGRKCSVVSCSSSASVVFLFYKNFPLHVAAVDIQSGGNYKKIKDNIEHGRGELEDRTGTHIDPFNAWEEPGRTQWFQLDPILCFE